MPGVMLLFAVLRKGLQFSREIARKLLAQCYIFWLKTCKLVQQHFPLLYKLLIHGENDGSWLSGLREEKLIIMLY